VEAGTATARAKSSPLRGEVQVKKMQSSVELGRSPALHFRARTTRRPLREELSIEAIHSQLQLRTGDRRIRIGADLFHFLEYAVT
jgi:hypothetical protein